MSLRTVHIIFVGCAILLSLGVGALQLAAYRRAGGVATLALGLFWVAAGVALAGYGRRAVQKLRRLSVR
jgi:hypothetical protein